MHRAIFGLITVAAFVAVGVLIYNQRAESSSAQNAADRTPVSSVVNGECCADTTEIAKGDSGCCCDGAAMAAKRFKGGSVAVSEVGVCEKTMATSAEGESCCGGEGEKCSAETGACCAEDSTVAAKKCPCCAEKKEAEATSTVAEVKGNQK